MIDFCKNMSSVFFSLLIIFLLCTPELLSIKANASEESLGPILRGEIWYGNASWYGPKFHGKRTSSGEKFNKYELTAAHQFLPFNTHVLVTNLRNNKSVIVRINDRGPYKGNRIIDLSEGAANEIEAKQEGITYVKVRVLPKA